MRGTMRGYNLLTLGPLAIALACATGVKAQEVRSKSSKQALAVLLELAQACSVPRTALSSEQLWSMKSIQGCTASFTQPGNSIACKTLQYLVGQHTFARRMCT